MHDMHDPPTGKPLYFLTKEDYEDLRNIQTMLVVTAQVTYGDEDIEKDNTRLMRNRSDIKRFFAEVSAKIGRALDRIRKHNRIDP
jgi:hypothetical protein